MYFSIVPQSFNVCRWGACISRGICHYVVWRMVEEQWLRWKCPFISLLFLLCLLENWVPFWNSEVPNSAPIVEEISSFLASCLCFSLLAALRACVHSRFSSQSPFPRPSSFPALFPPQICSQMKGNLGAGLGIILLPGCEKKRSKLDPQQQI